MKNTGIKLFLYLNYFVFAILLNSVGIVMLKSQLIYGVEEFEASVLEGYKDFSIAIMSFLFLIKFFRRNPFNCNFFSPILVDKV